MVRSHTKMLNFNNTQNLTFEQHTYIDFNIHDKLPTQQ